MQMAVLDDFFPLPMSGFRFEEFRCYLDALPNVTVHSTCGAVAHHGRDNRSVDELIAAHVAAYPEHARRVLPMQHGFLPEADAYYAIFLNNIIPYVDAIESAGKLFAFTLYPGGGLRIADAVSDEKLRRVCNSPSLHKIIVTQPNVLAYLAGRNFVPALKIAYIQGGVIRREAFLKEPKPTRSGLNIGFIANRYTPRGEDKGYDLFVETARAVTDQGLHATYHVVGAWSDDIISLDDLATRFVFHGYAEPSRLRAISASLDIVISPNRSNALADGAFDGFPTGSCVEAGLQEAAIVSTDPLELGSEFTKDRDFILIEPNVSNILRKLIPLMHDPQRIIEIGRAGRRRLTEVFRAERQMPPRIATLCELISAQRSS